MKKRILPVVIIIALIFITGAIYAVSLIRERFAYSGEQTDTAAYYGLTDPDDAAIIYNDSLIDNKAKVLDGRYYLDIDVLKDYINGRFYYGEADGLLFYTTPTDTYMTEAGSSSWYSDAGDSGEAGFALTCEDDGTLYVSLDYAACFGDIYYRTFTDPARIQIISGSFTGTLAQIKKKTAVRIRGGRKSEIVSVTDKGAAIVTEPMDEWSRIITWDGHIGYVENSCLDVTDSDVLIDSAMWESANLAGSLFEQITQEVTSLPQPAVVDEYTHLSLDTKVNMGFHAIGGTAGNATIDSVLGQARGLNVIAPTWFSLTDSEGNIQSFATQDYVNRAHADGILVWAVVDDFTSGAEVDKEALFTHRESRVRLLRSLMDAVYTYGIDGINIDFEKIQPEYADSYVQFLRELSVACKAARIYLSIDDYVPASFNSHYDFAEQGVIADYVVLMGYDEHYAGSDEAGSVASIGYVSEGIQNMLEYVPAERLINAIPLYTRLWITEQGELSSKAVHMDGATNAIGQYGLDMNWDEETCQYYGEATSDDGILYQLWNEEAESIGAKLSVMKTAGIAGVAEWALGFESADIWDVITDYLAE